ncbi:MAG: sigma-70 family RNA polymerase sigma factor [Clostridia bacterium]|nr:sigma-70 family RNA polymerase sigma factor [Clostridia bacterium]MBQ8792451.1 sigma-70 family RNA polymerase sigma factor [Clostridia bacterium]
MTDEELIIKAQEGKDEALNELLKRYKSLVNKIARSYFLLGGEVEDIVQEGMIGLYKGIMHYSEDKNASFKTFATTCIKHQIQTAVKMASSEKNKVLSTALPIAEKVSRDEDEEEALEIIVPSTLPSPDDTVLEKEHFQEIKQSILKVLSPLEIKILSLYLKGYSYNEISNIASISKKSIDNGLSRIKHKLAFLKKEKL